MDFSITVSNSFRVFGAGQPTLWGEFDWGSGFWGEGSNTLALEIQKFASNSLAITESLTASGGYNSILSDSLSVTGDLTSETMTEGHGYSYVFTQPALNAEDRNLSTFTEVSGPTTTWNDRDFRLTSYNEASGQYNFLIDSLGNILVYQGANQVGIIWNDLSNPSTSWSQFVASSTSWVSA